MEERHYLTTTPSSDNTTTLVDFGNFWRKTEANFTACERPDTSPCFQSKSGSAYWDMQTHVIRFSNHWTSQHGIDRIVDCYWTIDITQEQKKQYVCGKCMYRDFSSKRKLKKRSNHKPPQGFGK